MLDIIPSILLSSRYLFIDFLGGPRQARAVKSYIMKENTHPTYYTDATIKCACGKVYITGSTAKELHIEICANCHPFYTGRDNLVDTAGRVDRFKRLVTKQVEVSTVRKGKKVKKERANVKKATKAKKASEK